MTSLGGKPSYQRKIKTKEQLQEIIGLRPREKSVVMCHGAFDLVHPGHLRHLTHAKSRADILIASLTCDAHISKADYRPFVPEELRALNLAALEVVDYVIIDPNITPIETILQLQPDAFAKGYEYSANGVNPRTAEEMQALQSYGGEMVFTPGDVVYSSSKFIETAPPNISAEKLAALMDSEGVTFDGLRKALDLFKGTTVHVLGDTIVDSYIYCSMIGSSTTKTPTLSVSHDHQADFIGGAAIVAKHLRAAGADVRFSTVLGDDPLKEFVLAEMVAANIETHASVDPGRVTTQKNVYIANNHRLLKVDKVDNTPIAEHTLQQLQSALSDHPTNAVVFSDFRHGIFNRRTIPMFTDSLPKGSFRVADSQVASRWGNILDFQGFDLITPNEREARFALAEQDAVIRPLALELYKQTHCKNLILKLGERGILTYRSADDTDLRSFFIIDSFATDTLDPMGAGDALLAYATLAMTATKSPVVASILGSMSAAVACEHEGNTPVTPNQVRSKIDIAEKQINPL